MNEAHLRKLLEAVRGGATDIDTALAELRDLPFRDLGFANIDHHRALRIGVPEVIYGEGKTSEQIIAISKELTRTGQNVLVTRLDAEKAARISEEIKDFKYAPVGRTGTIERQATRKLGKFPFALVSAGTSDLPVAEECAETARMLGVDVERIFDVGVAGIHRILDKRALFDSVGAVVVVAGMEGALASVVGGLVRVPVIAVPTSIGYGAAFGGVAALLGMLTTCASGVTVVNIDNGFGAAFAVARLYRTLEKE